MRVLCSTTPMEGVFGPFVALGRALAEAGHEVMVATGPDLQDRVREQGFAAAIAGPTALEGALAAAADPVVRDAPAEERWRFPAAMFGGIIAPRKLPALNELAAEFNPDLVVHAPVDVAGALLAAVRGLPSACYGFLQPLAPDVLGGIAERVAPLWENAGLRPDPHAGIYCGRYLDPCPPSLRSNQHPGAARLQPIRPEPPGQPDAALPAWAQQLGRRPTLYVSLGTVPFFNQPTRFRSLLAELLDDDIELIVTVSELHDPAALELSAPTLHAEQWLPLAPLLGHTAMPCSATPAAAPPSPHSRPDCRSYWSPTEPTSSSTPKPARLPASPARSLPTRPAQPPSAMPSTPSWRPMPPNAPRPGAWPTKSPPCPAR